MHLCHTAETFAHGLGCRERGYVGSLAREHIFARAAREALGRIGREVVCRHAGRRTPAVAAACECVVYRATVVGDRIAQVYFVFEPALDLERCYARVEHLADPARQVHVAYRQQMTPADYLPSRLVAQVVAEPAGLAALPAVARALRHRPRQKAPAAVADAYRTVDEALQFDRCRSAYTAYLVDRQGAFEHHARESAPFQKGRFAGLHVAHLRRGVQLDRQRHLAIGHVLYYQGVDIGRDKLACEMFGLLQLRLEDHRVERGVEPCAVPVGILRRAAYVVGGVGCGLTCAESAAAHVDGIGTAVYGCDGRMQIARRRKKFYRSHGCKGKCFVLRNGAAPYYRRSGGETSPPDRYSLATIIC